MSKLCIHCFISGRVQGVAFRHYTRHEAIQLGITGWARNLVDGRVEVMACGEARAIEQMVIWLHKGPPLARVDEVTCERADISNGPQEFIITG